MTKKENGNGSVTELQQPEGLELTRGLSFGRLGRQGPGDDGAIGNIAIRTQMPQLCGWITGIAYAERTGSHPTYGPFTGFLGEFYGLTRDGEEVNATECFLPGVAQRFVSEALKNGPCPIRLEGWCMPDMSAPAKFAYRVFVRQPPGTISLAKRMAIEAGIIAAPEGYVAEPLHLGFPPSQGQIAGPADSMDGAPPEGEEARIKDGLTDLLKPRAAAE